MVSFSCEGCGDVLTKKKLDPHRNRCRGATFTCIDCMVYFPGTEYRAHTSCMSEEQKYQGALYKEKNKKAKTNNSSKNAMAQHAYVEDADEWKEFPGQTNDGWSPAAFPPEAPTPPSAVPEVDVPNVFDFLVATGQTPNASNTDLVHVKEGDESQSLVRYERNEDDSLDAAHFLNKEPLVEYGAGPYDTPAASKAERRRKDGDPKTDKKRKRLHVDVPGDQVMTDAPPVLSSGLTGGLKGLMRQQFPPSPDYSGGDAAPLSPLKKSKHSKHSKHGQSNSIFGMMAGNTKTKTKKRKTSKKHSSREKNDKLIEYRPGSKDSKDGQDGQMILFKPQAEVLFKYVNKGPESDRGCSMNKVLKRFHRDRQAAGVDMSKHAAEKELWRSLRMRQNDRGEIVLFSV